MKAVVLTSQRSGSYFLEQCLNFHPRICCYGEILIGFGGLYKGGVPSWLAKSRLAMILWKYVMSGAAIQPVKILDDFFSRGEANVMCFRAMYSHLKRDPRVHRYFSKDRNIRIIHLSRDNVLKQYVSLVLMRNQHKHGRTTSHTTKPVVPVSTYIEPKAALASMDDVRERYQHYERVFANHPKIELVYEEMIDNGALAEPAARAVSDLLEVDLLPMNSGLVKMNPHRLDRMVENYDELVAAIRGTEYERLLD